MSGYGSKCPWDGFNFVPWAVTVIQCKVTGTVQMGTVQMPQITAQVRGQLLAAAGSWRTDGAQREPGMRIGVRGGAIRCFSFFSAPAIGTD